ncbi:unnamed protein product [Prorocentrum cordatum]|uniref:Transmembrane protein n=1 Tax=Prorocentrum cordatum TaxID=2364126 RepID=A0ABN9W535_9DINO|nr:unnamed protein product [Polarella glacialis]
MIAFLTLFALPSVASSLSLHKAEAEEGAGDMLFALSSEGASQKTEAEEGAGDMLFALSSEAEAQQAGERAEDEYTSVSSLLSEAEALLQEEVASDREAAEEEIALLQEVDADERVAEEEMDAETDPEAPAAEAAPAAEEAPAAAAEAPVAEAAPAREAAVAESSEGAAANTSENATEVQADENQSRANLSTYFDPKLMAIFREKQAHLKETMKDFMVSKKELDVAKLAANLAMKKLRLATEKRRKILMGERMAEAEERRAIKESRRQAKTDMTARAEQLLADSLGGLSGVNMSYMVDVVLALPEALQDEEFVEDFRNVTKRVDVNVRKFLDQTQQKTTQFVKDSTSASDVELRFIMAKFFHESGFRLRGLHQDSLKAIQMLRRTVPEDLERALFPFLGQLNANTVRLRINATSLATATPKEACDQITQIMANVSDFDSIGDHRQGDRERVHEGAAQHGEDSAGLAEHHHLRGLFPEHGAPGGGRLAGGGPQHGHAGQPHNR